MAARLATGAAVLLIVFAGACPAAARLDPGGPAISDSGQVSDTSSPHMTDGRNCPLTRVGKEFVRCDNLTGAGVPAPDWVPER